MKKLTLVILSQLLALNVFAAGKYNSIEGSIYSINFNSKVKLLSASDEKNLTFTNEPVQLSEMDAAHAQFMGEQNCWGKFTLVSIRKATSGINVAIYPNKPVSSVIVTGFCTKKAEIKLPVETPITTLPVLPPVIKLPVETPIKISPIESPITTLPVAPPTTKR